MQLERKKKQLTKIVDKKTDYVLPVKDNQKELRKQIKSRFDSYNNLYGNFLVYHAKKAMVESKNVSIF